MRTFAFIAAAFVAGLGVALHIFSQGFGVDDMVVCVLIAVGAAALAHVLPE